MLECESNGVAAAQSKAFIKKTVNTTRSRIEFRFLARARQHWSRRAVRWFPSIERERERESAFGTFLPIYAEWMASSAIELSIKWEKSSVQRQKNHLQYAHTHSHWVVEVVIMRNTIPYRMTFIYWNAQDGNASFRAQINYYYYYCEWDRRTVSVLKPNR